ncbi:diaminopimelate epimerase [Helcobacillus massiliensis]|uniref:diaminopimelate epimerase n=1 Tax=Helcobacillus massiliensis TaxID=521392 RepID=UPI00255465C2|nr:diaminopimelate epimerase [Helcobacillus massiliensis]MDK7742479.1 diaminopimelate epimerase [Helcobacillus massiliensis]WOO93337.1 diaminopimelate epimerase [Helcobacillus massiliensis]
MGLRSTDPRISFGHGTKNTFVLVDDPDGELALTEQDVRDLAALWGEDSADGVIRVVRTAASGEGFIASGDRPDGTGHEWFMDYRNADGSIAQMCGNGVRVFAAHLRDRGWVEADEFPIMTRAGERSVTIEQAPSGGDEQWQVKVGMGPARTNDAVRMVTVDSDSFEGRDVDLGNPHCVVQLPDGVDYDCLNLADRPDLTPEPADGANIEFVQVLGDRHIRMRVFERGVGETLSCGTGATAAVAATADALGEGWGEQWLVDVRGGQLRIGWDSDGHMTLAGPAVLSRAD